MRSILKFLNNSYDYYTDRFESFIASTPEEKAACYHTRQYIFGKELKRDDDRVAEHAIAKMDLYDPVSTLIACRDVETHEIIGSLRLTPAHLLRQDELCLYEYKLKLFPASLLKSMSVISRFHIEKACRGTVADLSIIFETYEYLLQQQYVIAVITCELGLFQKYSRIGFRLLDRIYESRFGGYRAPMYIVLHDYAYLRQCKSPLLRIARKMKFPKNRDGIRWHKKIFNKKHSIDPGFMPVHPKKNNYHDYFLFKGLSEGSVNALLKNAVSIKTHQDEIIVRAGDGSSNMGIVISGAVAMKVHGKVCYSIEAGDCFGELAFIVNTPRDMDIVAAKPNTEVVLLSNNCLKKITHQQDVALLWQNLAKLLAMRMLLVNSLLR